jgi:hypothetical protein
MEETKMRRLKSLAAMLLLTLLIGVAAPRAFAGEMSTPGFTDGPVESPGVTGPQESPGFAGDIIAALIAALS